MTVPANSLALYRRLLGYVRPYRHILIAAVLANLVAGAIEGGFAYYVKVLIDWLANPAGAPRWIQYAAPGVLIVMFLVAGTMSFIGGYGTNWVGTRVVLDLRQAMFARLVQAPLALFDRMPTGHLVSRFANDVNALASASTNVITSSVKDTGTVVIALAYLLTENWKLTLIVFAVAPILALLVRIISKRLRSLNQRMQAANARFLEVLMESLTAQKVIKVYGAQPREIERVGQEANTLRRLMVKHAAAAAAGTPITQLVVVIAVAVILWIAIAGGGFAEASAMTTGAGLTSVGSVAGFLGAIAILLAPLKRLASLNEHIQRGVVAAQSVFEMIDTHAEEDRGTQTLRRARGDIRFEHVTHHYGDEVAEALRSIDLDIRAGETIALVGASGSGKTTLVNLIPRFYTPARGRILLDGIDTTDLTLASLREQIALVSQDVRLFNDSIAANIAYAAPQRAMPDAIRAAADAAHVSEFVARLPEGLDTRVGEDGKLLSGGQRQRLAIARAFLKDAPVLILDEATSALDNESERHVQQALDTLMRGRTTIIVAHRLSTIERADRIVVLDRGQIVEQGTHAELLAKGGTYAGLQRAQNLIG